jgi:hypothetical protein
LRRSCRCCCEPRSRILILRLLIPALNQRRICSSDGAALPGACLIRAWCD